jgi:hypothetical protein
MADENNRAMYPLKSIADETMPTLTEDDRAILTALRTVLVEHKATERFGVTLLHEHFPLTSGERLIETVDVDTRTLTIRPTSEINPNDTVDTAWRFSSDSTLPIAIGGCRWESEWDYSTQPPTHRYVHRVT